MYVLTEYTQNSIALGIAVTNSVAKTQRHVLTLLEPTYVIYPYYCTLEGDKHSGIIFSAAAEGEENIPDSNSAGKLGLIAAANKSLPSVAWPPNTAVLDANLATVSEPYTLYTFLDSNAMDTAGHTFNIFSMRPPMTGGKRHTTYLDDTFTASTRAMTAGVSYSQISIEGIQYQIRTPELDVVADWNNLVFTEEEVAFLHALKIQPDILNEIYGDTPWAPDLARNMATIVQSKCFQDPRMVLHTQCQESQRFIAKILNYWVTNDQYLVNIEAGEEIAMKNILKSSVVRNPFQDGALDKSNRNELTKDILHSIDNNEYYKDVKVEDRLGKTSIGRITTRKADNRTEAESDIKAQYEALKVNYPNYKFDIEE